jgi:hypothetical protein
MPAWLTVTFSSRSANTNTPTISFKNEVDSSDMKETAEWERISQWHPMVDELDLPLSEFDEEVICEPATVEIPGSLRMRMSSDLRWLLSTGI